MINKEISPTPEQLAYLAGLVDGEGWIGITRRKRAWKRTPERYYYLRPALVIGMATEEPLATIAPMFGRHAEHISREGDTYRLRFHARTLRWLLPLLIPHLILKRRHAEILLRFLTDCQYQGKELTVDQLLNRETLAGEIRMLNESPKARRLRLGSQVS